LQNGKKYVLDLADDATFIQALAMVDKEEFKTTKALFPIYDGYIHNYLQLFINLKERKIYDDVGVFAYAPDEQGTLRKFNPIREDINFNLYPNSQIQLQPDVGC
jgi:hypothetical protein